MEKWKSSVHTHILPVVDGGQYLLRVCVCAILLLSHFQ